MKRLYLFDMDGTLIRSFLREGAPREDYDKVEILPKRVEVLKHLVLSGHQWAVVTNQGGVGFGYQTLYQVARKLESVLKGFGVAHQQIRMKYRPNESTSPEKVTAYVALHHPKATDDYYLCPETDDWRKPGPGMLLAAMQDYGVDPGNTYFIGDMDTDRQAAEAAGVSYIDAEEFFSV